MIRTEHRNRSRGFRHPHGLVRAVVACAAVIVLGAVTPPVGAQIGADGETTGTPRLVVPEDTYNWGEVLKEEEVLHTFVIRNDGDAPLLIKDIKKT